MVRSTRDENYPLAEAKEGKYKNIEENQNYSYVERIIANMCDTSLASMSILIAMLEPHQYAVYANSRLRQ